MTTPRAFCEFPAGLASVSLRLHGGPGCRPPISRMGNKAGYAETILWTLGLTAGKSAGAYVWAEADDDVRALLRAYPDPALLLQIAEIIRGWADEEPRALWERLRAERRARIALASGSEQGSSSPDALARHAVEGWLSYGQSPDRGFRATAGGTWPDDPPDPQTIGTRCGTLAEFAMNRLINVAGPELRNTGKGGTTFGGAEFATPAGEVAGGFEAAAVILHKWSFSEKGPDKGYGGPGSIVNSPGANWTTEQRDRALGCERTAGLVEDARSSWPPVAVLPRIPSAADLATWLGTPGDLDGVVVYMDPPYLDTTGYLHSLSRAEVVSMAIDFAAMGAHVAISEAVALPELMALGWYASEITGGRKGQKRTFSKQQGEFLTMNRPAAYTVAQQVSMFAP